MKNLKKGVSKVGLKIVGVSKVGLYGKEMFDYTITNADLTYIVNCYSITQLNSSGINETILNLMSFLMVNLYSKRRRRKEYNPFISWIFDSIKDLCDKVYPTKSGLGTISILIGGVGKIVVTVLVPSVIVSVPTSDIVCAVNVGLTLSENGSYSIY
jgi:hypothetical protein